MSPILVTGGNIRDVREGGLEEESFALGDASADDSVWTVFLPRISAKGAGRTACRCKGNRAEGVAARVASYRILGRALGYIPSHSSLAQRTSAAVLTSAIIFMSCRAVRPCNSLAILCQLHPN